MTNHYQFQYLIVSVCVLYSVQECIVYRSATTCTHLADLRTLQCTTRSLSLVLQNDTESLKKSDFASCSNISNLEVNYSPRIEKGIFDNLGSLKAILIQNSIVNALDRDLFTTPLKLEVVRFQNNSMTDIEPDSLRLLENIKDFTLNWNNVREIKYGVFTGMDIEHLELPHNEISFIEQDAFARMEYLVDLNLSGNMLQNFIAADVIPDCPDLEMINLSKNNLSYLSSDTFYELRELDRLDLSHNRISEIEPRTFGDASSPKLRTLTSLWLQGNKLSRLSKDTFTALTNLEYLNLGYNQISTIEDSAFRGLDKLILAGNQLTSLTSAVFKMSGDSQVDVLDISYNKLSYLSPDFLSKLVEVEKINIFGNPWQCGCFDYILLWTKQNEVQLICEEEYISGKYPTCVVVGDDRKYCTTREDDSLFETFSSRIKLHPLPRCYKYF